MNKDQFQEKNSLTKISFVDMYAKERGITPEEFLKKAEETEEAVKAPLKKNASSKKKKWSDLHPEVQSNWKPEGVGGVANDLLRSSLFGIIKKGAREAFENKKLAAYGLETEIFLTGFQLDQFDLDVYMFALYRHSLLKSEETKIFFSITELLSFIGKNDCGDNIRQVKASLSRLHATSIRIKSKGFGSVSIHLFETFGEDEGSGEWCIIVNLDLQPLQNMGNTWIDIKLRNKLKGDLTKWLAAFICTHTSTKDHPTKISLQKLYDLSGSAQKIMRRFKQEISKAMTQLKNELFVDDWRFESSVLVFIRSKAIKQVQIGLNSTVGSSTPCG